MAPGLWMIVAFCVRLQKLLFLASPTARRHHIAFHMHIPRFLLACFARPSPIPNIIYRFSTPMSSRAPICILVVCGLPAAGKSSVTRTLLHSISHVGACHHPTNFTPGVKSSMSMLVSKFSGEMFWRYQSYIEVY